MNAIKPWYLSRTIWASVATVLLAIAGFLGMPVAGIEGGAFADALIQLVTAIAGITAILGRMNATKLIG